MPEEHDEKVHHSNCRELPAGSARDLLVGYKLTVEGVILEDSCGWWKWK
jgi:hypothetical protein